MVLVLKLPVTVYPLLTFVAVTICYVLTLTAIPVSFLTFHPLGTFHVCILSFCPVVLRAKQAHELWENLQQKQRDLNLPNEAGSQVGVRF